MLPRIARTAPALLTFVFSLVAFVFSILAITSPEWAVRHNYDDSKLPWQWDTPIFTNSRSPFKICNGKQVEEASSTTSSATATSTSTDETSTATEDATTTEEAASTTSTAAPTYTVVCQNYWPYGLNRTSCEIALAIGPDDTAKELGDDRFCQQIHYAGNFSIASATFTTLGFILTMVMTAFTFFTLLSSRNSDSHAHESHKTEGDNGAGVVEGGHTTSSSHKAGPRSTFVPYINIFLVTSLVIGAVTGVIAQFYGIEGLVQSAPNNADFAASGNTDNTHGNHGPWTEGRGLSRYVTVSWGFAFVAALFASRAWRMPRWDSGI